MTGPNEVDTDQVSQVNDASTVAATSQELLQAGRLDGGLLKTINSMSLQQLMETYSLSKEDAVAVIYAANGETPNEAAVGQQPAESLPKMTRGSSVVDICSQVSGWFEPFLFESFTVYVQSFYSAC